MPGAAFMHARGEIREKFYNILPILLGWKHFFCYTGIVHNREICVQMNLARFFAAKEQVNGRNGTRI